MATRIAWWLNLDAELELERPQGYRPHPEVNERARALVARLRTLVSPEDVVLDGRRRAADLPGFVPLAFSATPSAQRALAALGFEPRAAPPLSLLRALARRSFAAGLGQTLQGARYVTSLEDLSSALAQPCFTGEWLLKRDFSFAARERRRVRGTALDAPTLGFAKRSFARGQGLQVEPYVRREADFAQHGYVCSDGSILLGAPMRQQCDARGVWQRSEALPADALPEHERTALTCATQEAGAALSRAGYAGPFGVDAFRYWGERGRAFQPRSEVNVRFSMGYPRALLERALRADAQGDLAAPEV